MGCTAAPLPPDGAAAVQLVGLRLVQTRLQSGALAALRQLVIQGLPRALRRTAQRIIVRRAGNTSFFVRVGGPPVECVSHGNERE